MEQLIGKQREFFNSNTTKPIKFRIEQLKKLYKLIKENEEELNQAIYNDFKKSPFDNYSNELALVYHDITEACRKVKKWAKIKKVKINLANFPAKCYVIPEPLGVSLVIGAWNYPYQLSLAPAIAAMAAGNTVVLKPSEVSSNTSQIMAKIINNNFLPEYFAVVEGGVSETTELLKQKFDKIFFTGSTTVGRIVYKAAAANLTPVTLELGGKSPAFITESANLKVGIKRLVWAKFLNAGQTCIAPDYIYVHTSIKEKFLQSLKAEIEKSQFSFDNENYVQIINQKNMERLIKMLDAEKVYFGGTYDMDSRFIAPTIMTNINWEDKIMQEEIFGPILPVIEYDDLDKAISEVKERPKPLSCYIYSENKRTIKKILHEISFGGGAVNDSVMHIANSNMPFGGVGESGIGSYHGEAGFKTFTHYKSILEKNTWFEPAIKYFPHTKGKFKLIKYLMRF